MKYVFLLINFVLLNSVIYASYYPKCYFGKWGIEYSKDINGYQKYVGKKVVYISRSSSSSSDSKKFPGELNTKYVITKIKMGSSHDRIKILMQKLADKSKIKLEVSTGYSDKNLRLFDYAITNRYTLPLLLIEEFENDKEEFVGKIFSDPRVKYSFKSIDFGLETLHKCQTVYLNSNDDSDEIFSETILFERYRKSMKESEIYPQPAYTLKNTVTNEIIKVGLNANIYKACFEQALTGVYIGKLINIDKPADETIRYGASKTIKDDGLTKFSYIDNLMDIVIFLDNTKFNFVIKNISDNTIKVVWNEAVYVGFNGVTSRIMHSGVKYSEKNNEQPSSIIIKGATLSDIAVPVSNVRYSDILKEWIEESIFPSKPNKEPGQLKIMLPIQIKDVINEYIFTFNVEWVNNYPEYLNQ